MTTLYNNMLNIDKIYYLPCWYLYMDLIETRYNPEQTQFYDWSSIYNNDMFYDLHLLIRNIEGNMNIVIAIVEKIVKNITNDMNGYTIYNNNDIEISIGLSKCELCGNVWDGYAQCMCV